MVRSQGNRKFTVRRSLGEQWVKEISKNNSKNIEKTSVIKKARQT